MMTTPHEMNETSNDEQRTLSYDDLTRRDVRALIFHLLYAMEAFNYEDTLESIVDNYNAGFELSISWNSEVFKTVQAVVNEREELDEMYKPLLTNWRFDRIGVSTKLILRFALWELKHSTTDPRIIINEAVELAKCFAEDDAYRFINGILDRLAHSMGRVTIEQAAQPEQSAETSCSDVSDDDSTIN
jgi:N utilization substance protein B